MPCEREHDFAYPRTICPHRNQSSLVRILCKLLCGNCIVVQPRRCPQIARELYILFRQ